MLILVATHKTQGARKSDFNFCYEGEPIQFAGECDDDWNTIDAGCGCRRSFSGLHTSKATTTAKVIDVDMSQADLEHQIRLTLHNEGWLRLTKDPSGHTEMIRRQAREVLRMADHFGEGAIIEKRGACLKERKQKGGERFEPCKD